MLLDSLVSFDTDEEEVIATLESFLTNVMPWPGYTGDEQK